MRLSPGDSIGICPQNPSSLVDSLLQRLQVDPNQVRRSAGPVCTVPQEVAEHSNKTCISCVELDILSCREGVDHIWALA